MLLYVYPYISNICFLNGKRENNEYNTSAIWLFWEVGLDVSGVDLMDVYGDVRLHVGLVMIVWWYGKMVDNVI
ncbi:hypothetical protein L1987_80151 [Smallanthus sonchifolius]|uniref:Uncharacterized protein n=1 Tax=Smallanthus sonchifolius TaxID=185202 RepID=A0ACB8YM26_9ASTR|nr:hypothetical protein L1987_80151 [Smallanthus sonchifolius]